MSGNLVHSINPANGEVIESEEGTFALTVTAAKPRPVKLEFDTLPAADILRARIDAEIPTDGWYDDVHGAPAWRRHMTLHFAHEIRDELDGAAR